MLNLFKKKPVHNNKFFTIDINSSFIKTLAFYLDEGKLKVIGQSKIELPAGATRGGVIIEENIVSNALAEGLEKASSMVADTIPDCIFSVSGDLSLGITTTVRAKRKHANPISQKELDELYQRISEASLVQAENDFLQITGNDDMALEIITSSNVYSKVNGVYVEDLLNQKGENIEIAEFNTFAPAQHLKSLQHLASKNNLNIVTVASDLYAITKHVMLKNPECVDATIIKVGYEYTEVAVVFGTGIVSTRALNVGYKHFIEGISDKMGLTLREGDNVLRGYIENKLTQSEVFVVKKCLIDTLKVWLDGLTILFEEFNGVKTFASKIFISGEGMAVPDVIEMINTEPWAKAIPFKEQLEVKKVEISQLDGIVDSTGSVNSLEWTTNMALSNIYKEIFNHD